MEDNRTNKRYAVVGFLPKNTDGTNQIDLVPSKWITQDGEELFSYYPPADDYHKLNKYVRELRDAKDSWLKYPVEILSYAENYSQGIRRLNRAFTTIDIRSTDDDSNRTIVKPPVISQSSVLEEMGEISPMHEEDSSTGSIEKKKSKKKSKQKNSEVISSDPLRPIAEETGGVIDLESLKEFITSKINEQTALLQRSLVNNKKSLQYDLKKYVDEIKNTLIANKVATDPQQSASNAIETLNVELPLKNLEEFQEFDADLKNTSSKREALLTFFRIKIFGEKTAKGCISKMASALMTKNIEKHYSGTGKKIKGVGKLNFSATETFKCMEDVVKEKLGDCEDCKNFAGKVGRWLSGQGDREHGRKERSVSV